MICICIKRFLWQWHNVMYMYLIRTAPRNLHRCTHLKLVRDGGIECWIVPPLCRYIVSEKVKTAKICKLSLCLSGCIYIECTAYCKCMIVQYMHTHTHAHSHVHVHTCIYLIILHCQWKHPLVNNVQCCHGDGRHGDKIPPIKKQHLGWPERMWVHLLHIDLQTTWFYQ